MNVKQTIERCGGPGIISKRLNCTTSCVTQWVKRGEITECGRYKLAYHFGDVFSEGEIREMVEGFGDE